MEAPALQDKQLTLPLAATCAQHCRLLTQIPERHCLQSLLPTPKSWLGLQLLACQLAPCSSPPWHAGDWFNRLDFSMQSHNFGIGLPPRGKNEATWPLKQRLLADGALRPWPQDIELSYDVFR